MSSPNGPAPWYSYQSYLEYIGDGQSLAVPFHTPVTFPFPGVVTRATTGDTGVQVDVARPDGTSYSFVHLDTLDPSVKPGAAVRSGQFAGLSGGENADYPGAIHPATPQYSTGPHIDFDMWTAQAWRSTPQPSVAASVLASLQKLGLPTLPSTNGVPLSAPSPGGGQGPGGIIPSLPTLITDPLSAFQAIGAFLSGLLPWVSNPLRVAKLVAGGGLIWLAILVTFRDDVAAGIAAASGTPEVGAAFASGKQHGPIGGGIRTAGAFVGQSESSRAKQAAKAQRAYAAGRAINVQRAQAATTRNLGRQVRAQQQRATGGLRAAPPTVPLGGTPAQTQPQGQAPRAGRLGPLLRNTRNGPVPANTTNATPNPTPVSPVKSGRAGFGGFGFTPGATNPPASKAPRVPKVPKASQTADPLESQVEWAKRVNGMAKPPGMTWGDYLNQPIGTTVVTKTPIPRRRYLAFLRTLRQRPKP